MRVIRAAVIVTLALGAWQPHALAQSSPSSRFPDLNHFESPEPQAAKELRIGLRFKGRAEKAHAQGKIDAERKALDAARFHLRLSLDTQETNEARLSLGEVELMLGNQAEATKNCQLAGASGRTGKIVALTEAQLARATACRKASERSAG